MKEDTEKRQRWTPQTNYPEIKSKKAAAPHLPPKDTRVEDARTAIYTFLGTAGDLYLDEAEAAFRKLDKAELKRLERTIPMGSGRTASKCDRMRQVLADVMQEKA